MNAVEPTAGTPRAVRLSAVGIRAIGWAAGLLSAAGVVVGIFVGREGRTPRACSSINSINECHHYPHLADGFAVAILSLLLGLVAILLLVVLRAVTREPPPSANSAPGPGPAAGSPA